MNEFVTGILVGVMAIALVCVAILFIDLYLTARETKVKAELRQQFKNEIGKYL